MCFGGKSEPRLLGRAHRGAEGFVGGVGFRRGGDIEHGLRDRELAFGRAQEIVGVLGGIGDHQRLRIGEADVLDGHAHHPPRHEQRVLAGIEHAREIIQRRVGIGAAHRLMQRRDQVVVAVGRLVVDRRAALQDVLQLHGIEDLAAACGAPDLLGQSQRGAAVAIGHPHQHGARLGIERQRLAFGLLGMNEQFFDRVRVERMKHQHPRARQQRGVELEGWIFGGGPDQYDRAVLHHGQKRVLLRAIEAMHLVDEQQRALARLAAGARAHRMPS